MILNDIFEDYFVRNVSTNGDSVKSVKELRCAGGYSDDLINKCWKSFNLRSDINYFIIDAPEVMISSLTTKENYLFSVFKKNQGKVMPHETLCILCGIAMSDCYGGSLRVHISNINRKLRKIKPRREIVNSRGSGYMLMRLDGKNDSVE